MGWRCWSCVEVLERKGGSCDRGRLFCGGMLDACVRESGGEGTVRVLACACTARACVTNGAGKGAAGGRGVARAESLRVRSPEMSRAAREGVAMWMG